MYGFRQVLGGLTVGNEKCVRKNVPFSICKRLGILDWINRVQAEEFEHARVYRELNTGPHQLRENPLFNVRERPSLIFRESGFVQHPERFLAGYVFDEALLLSPP